MAHIVIKKAEFGLSMRIEVTYIETDEAGKTESITYSVCVDPNNVVYVDDQGDLIIEQ